MRVCLGGTFDRFHAGHRALLDGAFDGATEVFVGVTQGALSHRDRDLDSFAARSEAVHAYAEAAGFRGTLVVRPLEDAMGPAATESYDRIVVSPETVRGADAINAARRAAGLAELEVRVVPHRLAQDLRPISATRIAAGDIDAEGRRRTPVRVAVGSRNPVKVAAVEEEVAAILGCDVAVLACEVASGVPEQPRQSETRRGAENRARAALAAADADYGIGVEAGLVQDPDASGWYDVQACVVVDADGLLSDGWGPAFQYPDWVTQRALRGEMISDILGPVADDPRIGGTTGAIGFLTDGHLDRTALTRSAVTMAFVPRIRRGLYS